MRWVLISTTYLGIFIPFEESRKQLTTGKRARAQDCNLSADISVNVNTERKEHGEGGACAGGSGNWASLEEARSVNANGAGAGRAAQSCYSESHSTNLTLVWQSPDRTKLGSSSNTRPEFVVSPALFLHFPFRSFLSGIR